jgi:pentatricopeptide repeat protein
VHSKTTTETPNSLTLNRFIHDPDLRTQSSSVKLLDLLKNALDFPYEDEAMDFLDESRVKPSNDLINSVILGLKDEWKLAYFVFKWGEKWGCNDEKNRSLIVWILGTNKKFNTAWCLIRDMHRASMDTKQGMLVMIDRYAAANDPSKAIQTFQTMEKFSMILDLVSVS